MMSTPSLTPSGSTALLSMSASTMLSPFRHRLRRILGIDAGAAEEEEAAHAVAVCFGDDVALYLHVLQDEVGTVEGVCHDAADKGGGEDNGIGTFGIEEAADGELVGEVKLGMGAADEILIAARLAVVPDGGAYKSAMAGDINLAVFIE